MIKFFTWRDNPDGTYSIAPMYKEFGEDWRIMGSWSVLPARLFGLSWPNYLRYCISLGARVTGKQHLYPTIKWEKPNYKILDELNRRANLLIKVEG